MTQETNIFKAVQEKYNIVDVANDLGIRLHKVGANLRADSLAGNGQGKDAFAVYEETNTWHDFMTGEGRDITDLVAKVRFNGDKYRALCELMPEYAQNHNFKQEISKRENFSHEVKRLSDEIFAPKNSRAYEYLKARGITDETIKTLQIGVDYSGGEIRIRFPYWDFSGTKILYYTTRRITENENSPKYKKASLQAFPFLKNAPLGLNTIKNNDNDFCIITEGVFDWLQCYQQGFSVLSPNGCDFGKLWPEVIELIKQHFKFVVLAFDSDEAGQKGTAKAAEILMKERIPFRVVPLSTCKDVADYCQAGGKVQTLINSASDGKKWFIRYLRPQTEFNELTPAQQDEAMERCKHFVKVIGSYTDSADVQEVLIGVKKYFPKEWFSALSKEAKKGLSEYDVCERVLEKHILIFNEKVGYFEYMPTKGIWEQRDNTTILSFIRTVYGDKATGGKITSTEKTLRTHENVNSSAPIEEFNSQPCIAFVNGTLHIDMKTGKAELLPHDKNNFLTVRMPYFYNPKATRKHWDKFIAEVTCGDIKRQNVLQEFAGYSLMPTCKFEKALLLMGRGSNGKSIFTKLISAALGGIGKNVKGYLSAVEPSKFGKDFRVMPLRDSWLNISTETETDLRGGEGMFKKIVSGEILEDSYKHKDPITFSPRTKLIMCCNNLPKIEDTSEGFMRRWLIVEFPMHYVRKDKIKNGKKDCELDPNLEEKLMKEISGIFNWILEGLQRLTTQNEFTETDEQEKLTWNFANANNHLYSFTEDVRGELHGKIYRNEIFVKYRNWCESACIIPMAANRFYNNFRNVLEQFGIEFDEQGRFWIFEDNPNAEQENEPETSEKQEGLSTAECVECIKEIEKARDEIRSYPENDDRRQASSDSIYEILEKYGLCG